MNLSVVVPLFNEQENLHLLYDELTESLKDVDQEYEIIFVDDGSTDSSLIELKNIQGADSHVTVVGLRRNFGQTAAMAAGFDHASGEIVITMDGDLQNDPRDIPRLVKKINEGYDVVTGWRYERKDTFISRRLPSLIANRLISTITGVNIHDYGCTLKAFRREVVRNIRLYGEMHRFIPAIASGMGVSFTEIKVNHRPRRFGSSKYGISRTIRVLLDLMTVKFMLSYATRPLHVFGTVGFASFAFGIVVACILVIQRQFYDISMANRPLLLLAVLLVFMGIQFVTLGLLAELIVRTYHESQKKPIYYVRSIFAKENNNS